MTNLGVMWRDRHLTPERRQAAWTGPSSGVDLTPVTALPVAPSSPSICPSQDKGSRPRTGRDPMSTWLSVRAVGPSTKWPMARWYRSGARWHRQSRCPYAPRAGTTSVSGLGDPRSDDPVAPDAFAGPVPRAAPFRAPPAPGGPARTAARWASHGARSTRPAPVASDSTSTISSNLTRSRMYIAIPLRARATAASGS